MSVTRPTDFVWSKVAARVWRGFPLLATKERGEGQGEGLPLTPDIFRTPPLPGPLLLPSSGGEGDQQRFFLRSGCLRQSIADVSATFVGRCERGVSPTGSRVPPSV